jgi:class 3 adenylate cyclase
MTQKTESLAILFADIAGSTALYESLGDALARDIVARCIAIMTKVVQKYRGELIKTIGDEIMCVFASSRTAMLAACEMQESVERDKPGGRTQMFLRIGFHWGEVIRESNDVFGDAVNIAARMASAARAPDPCHA